MNEFEPYFLRWESMLFQAFGDERVIPLYVHRTCKQGQVTYSNIPPQVCPHCGVDTAKEQLELDRRNEGEEPSIILP
jgi:hypothetical protein